MRFSLDSQQMEVDMLQQRPGSLTVLIFIAAEHLDIRKTGMTTNHLLHFPLSTMLTVSPCHLCVFPNEMVLDIEKVYFFRHMKNGSLQGFFLFFILPLPHPGNMLPSASLRFPWLLHICSPLAVRQRRHPVWKNCGQVVQEIAKYQMLTYLL